MNKAFLAGLGLQLAVLLLPPLQGVFSVVPMTVPQWLAVLGLAAAPVPICELDKALRRKTARPRRPASQPETRISKPRV